MPESKEHRFESLLRWCSTPVDVGKSTFTDSGCWIDGEAARKLRTMEAGDTERSFWWW